MEKQTVHLFVFNTLSDWEASYAIAGINNPAFQTHPGRYQVKTVGVNMQPVTTIGGMIILPDMVLEELQPAHSAMLILPGGAGWEDGSHDAAVEKAKSFLAYGVPIAAICGATAGLARGGILDGVRHTSNAPVYLQTMNYQGAALYQQEPAVTDGNVITAGATAPIEFAYHIFKKLGVYTAEVLEAWYGLYKTGDAAYFFELQKLTELTPVNRHP
jgi:putative intracellular protease/amidase